RRAGTVERAHAEHVRPAEDRVQRRAQLVRDDRQELVLQPARRFGLPPRRLRVGELAALLFGALAIGDVELRAEHQDWPPIAIADRAAAARHGPLGPIGTDDPVFHLEQAAGRERLAYGLLEAGPIVAVDHVDEALVVDVETSRLDAVDPV